MLVCWLRKRCARRKLHPVEDLDLGDCVIPARDLSWTAVRSSGPGGQNVNKVATKVVLRFDLEGTRALSEPAKARLRARAAARIDKSGYLVLSAQRTRSLSTNLAEARSRLGALIAEARKIPRKRRATRPGRGATERRLDGKRLQSDKKRSRAERPEDS